VRYPQQVLRLVLLRMDRYALHHGTVSALSLGGRPVSWNVPNRAADRHGLLTQGGAGSTVGDGQTAMPLDVELGLIVNHVARFL
jgi:hypothetical protein